MAGIDMEQYEAARIDGANRLQKILYITLPGIMPTTVILLIMQMGSLFSSDFQKILLMYSPATYSTADVISTYTYRYGLENANYSYAYRVDAVSHILCVCMGSKCVQQKSEREQSLVGKEKG